jgi:1-acyl-sn-glycerol-3-phosphate acyltransferase
MSAGVRLETWGRRALTVPLYGGLCAAAVLGLPALVALAALVDVVRGGPWVTVRCVLFFTVYLCCEVAGVVASLALWLGSGVWAGTSRARFLAANLALQRWWARTLFAGAARIFRFTVEVEEPPDVARGPVLVFIRHASVGDTLVPAVFLSDRHGLALRYVLKRELLWDPCLDIVGNRLPNCFVRRGSGDSAREVAAVVALLDDLGPRDGVLIYPEGTRFTPAKRARILARLAAAGDAAVAARAEALTRVLPPRPGGPLALLEANPGAAVLFCAHVGFEGAGSFRQLLAGALVGRRVRIAFWRVPFDDIPCDPGARAAWLWDEWARVDRWVRRHGEDVGGAAATARRPAGLAGAGGPGYGRHR